MLQGQHNDLLFRSKSNNLLGLTPMEAFLGLKLKLWNLQPQDTVVAALKED